MYQKCKSTPEAFLQILHDFEYLENKESAACKRSLILPSCAEIEEPLVNLAEEGSQTES